MMCRAEERVVELLNDAEFKFELIGINFSIRGDDRFLQIAASNMVDSYTLSSLH